MTDFLIRQKGFVAGENVKASCRERIEKKGYYSNWDNKNISGAKYLIDKSLVIPDRDYYKGKGDIKKNKLIYILRNPYLGIKSHFLVALRGANCYSNFICGLSGEYPSEKEILKLSFRQVCLIIERNYLKIAHTLIAPKIARVFPLKNIFFTTLENLVESKKELKRLEKLLGVKFSTYSFPHKNKTADKYRLEHNLYKAGKMVFDKYSECIFKKYIIKADWENLSKYFKQDLIKEYNIR